MNMFTKYVSFYIYFFIFVNVACRINKSILLKNTLTIDSFNCKDKETQCCVLILSKPDFLVNTLVDQHSIVSSLKAERTRFFFSMTLSLTYVYVYLISFWLWSHDMIFSFFFINISFFLFPSSRGKHFLNSFET